MIAKQLRAIIITSAFLTCVIANVSSPITIADESVLVADTGAEKSVYLQAYEMFQSLVDITCISDVDEERSHCVEAKDILKEAEADLDRDL